jgi:hypothetical protein
MLRLYRHRVNTVAELEATPQLLGIEFDLRSDGDRVIVTHDPFTDGVRIEEFFPRIGRRPCIFNVKCEGVEGRVLSLAREHGIDDFFFLDCSVPAAVKLWRQGERRIGIRWSEYEPIEGVLAWAGKASWCWVDCFTKFPGSEREWAQLADQFQLCLVSPELQGHGSDSIASFRAALGGRHYHAACTKQPQLWTEST